MSESAQELEMVVGLEVHVQLLTATKAFCQCSTAFGDPPNQNTCPVCLALPGALPVLNEAAVTLAVRAALALDCTVHEESVFARKNYFYPDLPKGYQISQFDRPLATSGSLLVEGEGGAVPRRIGITRLHLEEDAGKSIHDRFPGRTAIDLNRAGVPLIEIVSEPDIRSAREAEQYLNELKRVIEYVGVSDADMEKGSLRVDANISTRPAGSPALGTKTEVKNLNSFSAVRRALEAEYARQCRLRARGEAIRQQTLLWDAARGEVRPSRTKEGSHDYRYFPEPDLPPLKVERGRMETLRAELPELPAARRQRFRETFALPVADARVLTQSRPVADYFEELVRAHGDARAAASWVMGEVMSALNAGGVEIEAFAVRPRRLAALLGLVRDGAVSRSAAKQIFLVTLQTGEEPDVVARREGLLQEKDEAAHRAWIDAVLAEHPAEARRFAQGERKLQGVLVGLVMKQSGGRADPRLVHQLLAARSGE